jgi:hypothetical protein
MYNPMKTLVISLCLLGLTGFAIEATAQPDAKLSQALKKYENAAQLDSRYFVNAKFTVDAFQKLQKKVDLLSKAQAKGAANTLGNIERVIQANFPGSHLALMKVIKQYAIETLIANTVSQEIKKTIHKQKMITINTENITTKALSLYSQAISEKSLLVNLVNRLSDTSLKAGLIQFQKNPKIKKNAAFIAHISLNKLEKIVSLIPIVDKGSTNISMESKVMLLKQLRINLLKADQAIQKNPSSMKAYQDLNITAQKVILSLS